MLLAVIVMFFVSGPVDTCRLKRACTRGVKIGVGTFQVLLVLLSDVLSTYIATFTKPVSFIKVTIPRVTGDLLGATGPLLIVPTYFLNNTIFYLFYSLVTEAMFTPARLDVDSIATIFKTPMIVCVVVHERREVWAVGSCFFCASRLAMNCSKGPLVGRVGVRLGGKRVLALVNPGNTKGSAVLGDVAERLSLVDKAMCLRRRRVDQVAGERISGGLTMMLARHVQPRLVAYRSIMSAKQCPCAKALKVLSTRSGRGIGDTVRVIRT